MTGGRKSLASPIPSTTTDFSSIEVSRRAAFSGFFSRTKRSNPPVGRSSTLSSRRSAAISSLKARRTADLAASRLRRCGLRNTSTTSAALIDFSAVSSAICFAIGDRSRPKFASCACTSSDLARVSARESKVAPSIFVRSMQAMVLIASLIFSSKVRFMRHPRAAAVHLARPARMFSTSLCTSTFETAWR